MKDPKTWEVEDLKELIATQAEESSALEFKHGKLLEDLGDRLSAGKRKDEISIAVSAFANRSGGIIIYGMEEERQEPHPAKALTPIDPAKYSKERLEQIILSRIKPSIPNIFIRPIKINASGSVYVVIISGSHTAHQASDGRYYRRANFGNQVMEDDEIRQIMNRPIKTTYRVSLRDAESTGNPGGYFISGNIQNTSVMMGNEVSAVLLLPNELTSKDAAATEVIDGNTFIIVLDELRAKVNPQLKPFERKDVYFTCKIPSDVPSFTIPLFVRVYDRLGRTRRRIQDVPAP